MRLLARLLDEALLAERAARRAQAVAMADADLPPLAVGVTGRVVALAAAVVLRPPARPTPAARAPSSRASPRAPRSAPPARRARPRGCGGGRRSWSGPSARRTTRRPRGGPAGRPRRGAGCRARPAGAAGPTWRWRRPRGGRGAGPARGRRATCRCRCRPARRGGAGRRRVADRLGHRDLARPLLAPQRLHRGREHVADGVATGHGRRHAAPYPRGGQGAPAGGCGARGAPAGAVRRLVVLGFTMFTW